MGSARKVSTNSPGKSSAPVVAPTVEGRSPSAEMGKGKEVKVKQEEKEGAIESPIKFYVSSQPRVFLCSERKLDEEDDADLFCLIFCGVISYLKDDEVSLGVVQGSALVLVLTKSLCNSGETNARRDRKARKYTQTQITSST